MQVWPVSIPLPHCAERLQHRWVFAALHPILKESWTPKEACSPGPPVERLWKHSLDGGHSASCPLVLRQLGESLS